MPWFSVLGDVIVQNSPDSIGLARLLQRILQGSPIDVHIVSVAPTSFKLSLSGSGEHADANLRGEVEVLLRALGAHAVAVYTVDVGYGGKSDCLLFGPADMVEAAQRKRRLYAAREALKALTRKEARALLDGLPDEHFQEES